MVSKHDTIKPLASFCQNRSTIRTRIALMTFYKIQYSELVERIIVSLEYLQVVSQAFLLFDDIEYDSNVSYRFMADIVVYFFKLMNPSCLVTFSNTDEIISSLLVILIGFSVARAVLAAYVLYVAFKDLKPNTLLIGVWQWIFKLQSRVTYYLITSFWVRAIMASADESFSLFKMGMFGSTCISVIMIAFEFSFSLGLDMQFCYVLPTKNFLASKSKRVQVLTLIQKSVMQVLQMSLGPNFSSGAWVTSIINLVMSCLKNYQYYRTLPLYKFKALVFKGDLMNLALAANITCFIHTLVWSVGFEGADMNFIVIVWIILSIMMIKIFRELLLDTLIRLMTNRISGSPELLLHKVSASKELNKVENLPGEQTEKYDYNYLLLSTQLANLREIFDLNPQKDSEIYPAHAKRKQVFQKIYVSYLESLSAKYPKNSLVKLFLARICAKDPDLYIKTIKIAAQIRQKEWSKNYLTSAFLLHEIEKSILVDCENSERKLDLLSFVENNVMIEKIKSQMLSLTEQKIIICKNVMEDTCNIGTIFNHAQSISEIKSNINKKIQSLTSSLPDNYVSPLLLFAEYHILANYSLHDYEKLGKLYLQRFFKYERQFKDLSLMQDNMYQEQNVFMILSGQKVSSGQIVYCSSAINNLCGGDRSAYVESHVSSLFTPMLRSYYDEFFKQIFETGNRGSMNKPMRAFLYHKDKHIVQVEFFLRIHPYITNNVCLQMLVRPVVVQNEYVLVREDGTIEGGTAKIARVLGINSASSINIRLYSEELSKMNAAFNLVQMVKTREAVAKSFGSSRGNLLSILKTKFKTNHFQEHAGDIDEKEAEEIYERYTSKGKKIDIKIYSQYQNRLVTSETGFTHPFRCKASILPYGTTFMKLIEFHETSNIIDEILSSRKDEIVKGSSRGFVSFRSGEGIEKQRFSMTSDHVFEVEKVKVNHDDASENVDCNERETNNVSIASPKMGLLASGTDRGLLSPKSSHAEFPLVPLIPEEKKLKFIKRATESNGYSLETGEVTNFNRRGEKKDNAKPAPRYLSSQQSSVKGDRSSYKSFKAAIKSRSYPKSFTILCVVFYAVIIATFISQIVLKVISDATMEDLVIKKNLLENAETLSYKAQQAQINCQAGALQIQGALLVNGVVTGMVDVLKNLKERVHAMEKARVSMADGLASLDADFQRALAINDVQLNGTFYASTDQVFRDLTLFQASEVLENAIHHILGLPNAVSKEGLQAFSFVGTNVLDDFLLKCNEVTRYFANSVTEQKEYFQRIVRLCLVVTPFTLLGVALAFILIVWSQYRIGKDYMLIFIKLRQVGGVKDIQLRLGNFRKNLKSGELLSSKNYMNYFGDLGTQMLDDKDQTYHKKNKSQAIIYSDYQRKYYSYVIRVVLYLSTLIAVMIWNYIVTENGIKIIYNKQNQLEFANFISTRISVGYAAFAALYIKNNTMPIEGDSAYNVFVRCTKEIVEIQNQVPSQFRNIDDSYDPEVQPMLFGKYSCENMGVYPLYHCSSLVNKGLPVHMLPALASYSSTIATKVRDFDNANKSTISTILAAAYKNIETFLPQYVTITNEAQMIANYIDIRLSENIALANEKRTTILIVFTVLLLLVSLLIWSDILVKLREVDNDFKKVLQVFPSKLVLSSFLLKMFLKKTSNEHLIL